jgi:hypothetical protein
MLAAAGIEDVRGAFSRAQLLDAFRMLAAAAIEAVHGVYAEQQSLENLAIPLSAKESDELQER